MVNVHPDRLELEIKEIDMVPSGKHLWQPGNNRPLENVEITPQMKERGFIPVGRLTIDTKVKPRQFKNPQGCFLKMFPTSPQPSLLSDNFFPNRGNRDNFSDNFSAGCGY